MDILATASQLQSSHSGIGLPKSGPPKQQVVDDFGMEYIQCIANLSTPEVKQKHPYYCIINTSVHMQVLSFTQPNTTFERKKGFGVRLDHVPNLSNATKHKFLTIVKKDNAVGEVNVPRYFLQLGGGKKVATLWIT